MYYTVLKEMVHQERNVRHKVRQTLTVVVKKIMQGYCDRRLHSEPQSQDEDYLSGWRMREETLKDMS